MLATPSPPPHRRSFLLLFLGREDRRGASADAGGLMQNAPAGALFPAFFSDGGRETHIGTVLVHPSLRFHDLKLAIGRQIGLPTHQFAVFLADRGDPRSWAGRVAVTAKFDFAAAARRDGARCCLLVVPRRPRRERRKGGRDEAAKSPPEDAMLLRRDHSVEGPIQSQIPDQRVGGFRPAMVDRYRELQAERERYLTMRAALEEVRRRRSAGHGVCEECEAEEASGCPSAFHCCRNDPVTVGFRTRAGPIARPVKGPGDGDEVM